MQSQRAAQQPAGKTKHPIAGILGTVFIFAAAGLLLLRMIAGGSTAPTPEYMPVTTDLASMQLREDVPVVAVVTADWCAPCQALKKNALADERVVELLSTRAQAIMIDGTDTAKASPTLQRLGVRFFPSTIVLRNGEPVAMVEGELSADSYLAWLEGQL